MKIFIEVSDKSLAVLAKQAEKQNCSIEELISMKLERKEQPTFEEEWSDEQVEDVMQGIYESALGTNSMVTFTAMNAFIGSYSEEKWSKLAPNTRKKIGRHFKAYVDEIGEHEEKLFIKAVGKTATNSITYRVCKKTKSLFANNK